MLDSFNRAIGSFDPLAKLSDNELRALEESLVLQMDATSLVSARDRLSFVETQQAVKPLLDQIVAVRLELNKRRTRWRVERKGFWVVAFMAVLAMGCFALWLVVFLMRAFSRGP